MTISEEQLQEWAELAEDVDLTDVSGVFTRMGMLDECDATRAAKYVIAVPALIAELREAREQLASTYMDGYEAAKEEYRPQLQELEAEAVRFSNKIIDLEIERDTAKRKLGEEEKEKSNG